MLLIAAEPVVNLQSEPDALSECVSQLLIGMEVRLLESREGWLRVAGPDDYPGWTKRSDIVGAPPSWEGAERLRVKPLYANLRFAPGQDKAPLMRVSIRSALPAMKRLEGWVGLSLPDGRTGWLEDYRLEPDAPRPSEPESLLASAREYLRTPYLWGGTSGFGIDCSGLAQAAYALHGIALPRDANVQASVGAAVSRDDVKAGDLVFFAASPDAPRERITHVGIAIDGAHLIHAWGRAGMVTESEIDPVAPFWGARRHLNHL